MNEQRRDTPPPEEAGKPKRAPAPSETPEDLVDLSVELPSWLERPHLVTQPRAGDEASNSPASNDPFYVDPGESFSMGAFERSLPAAASEPIPAGSVLEPEEELPGFASDQDRGGASAELPWSPPPPEAVRITDEDESPELAEVRLLVQSLAKAVKAARLYPLDNPVCQRFAQELVKAFACAFEFMAEVRLAVGKTKFFYRGTVVLEQPGREESVPGRFFWDGIREITFREGITPAEVFDFLTLCRRQHETAEAGEDDLVTLFWQRQFEHVAYIAVDDILDLENPDDPIPEEFGNDYMNFVDLEMHDLDDEEEIQRVSSEFAEEIRARLQDAEIDVFGVDPEARRRLMVELRDEDSPKMLEDVLQIILETLHLDRNEASFTETIGVIETALGSLIAEGRFILSAGLLRMLLELRQEREDLTPAMADALSRGLDMAWARESCDALAAHLNGNNLDALHGLEEFTGLLPEGATQSLLEVLSRVQNPRGRRGLVGALTRRARAGIDVFLPYLKDPRPEMVRDVATILADTRNDRALRPLKEAMQHGDVSVRCQVLDALARLGPAKSGDVLLAALFDADVRVRLAALKSLGQAGRVAVPTLLLLIDDKRFSERDFSERKAVFRALGAAGGQEVLPVIEPHLRQRSFFRRGQSDELRACACEALGWAGGPRAKDLLSGLEGDRSPMVRSAAQAALRRLSGDAVPDDAPIPGPDGPPSGDDASRDAA